MSRLTLQTIPYDQSLPRPIVTAHGEYRRRSGVLLILRDDVGQIGMGDAAPLPGFSRETIEDVRDAAVSLGARVSSGEMDIPDSPAALAAMDELLRDWTGALPSLRFAFETALADLSARRQRLPLALWLSETCARSVAVNALLAGHTPDDLRRIAGARSGAGFRMFKIKVGVQPVAADLARVAAVRRVLPEAQIRIDANAGWSEGQAREAFAALADMNLEFIEQPLAVGQAAVARRLSAEYEIPLALDEEIATVPDAIRLCEHGLCDILVLKPMMLGGISACKTVVESAQQRGIGVVFTSAWESDVGLAATLHLAAAYGSPTRAAGLATAGMISQGLVGSPLGITSGRLNINDASGLGLEPADPHV